jgi:hypothetical protein
MVKTGSSRAAGFLFVGGVEQDAEQATASARAREASPYVV